MKNVELRTRICDGYAVAELRGELDTTDAETVADTIAALTADEQQLIIDLEALDFIDCHAVRALLGVRETARQEGGDVLLAEPHGSVLRLLTVLGVPGVHASVAAAANSVGMRDARRRAVSIARFRRAALSAARYWMAARSVVVPGLPADGWPGTLRWLRARSGLRG